MSAPNYVQKGSRIKVSAGAAIAAGNLVRASGFVGVALNNALSGESVSLALDGVWGLTFSGQGTVSQGTLIYWDTSAGALSIGVASGDFAVGKAVTAVSATAFDMLLLPQGIPNTVEQA